MFNLKVDTQDHGVEFVRHWESLGKGSGSRALEHLANIGVEITDAGEFDIDAVAPRKLAVLELGDPRTAKNGRTYTGNVRKMVGL